MCLYLLDKPRIQRRNRAVPLFKVLRAAEGKRFEAPYRYVRYRSGETKQTKKFSASTLGFGRQKLFRDSFPPEIGRSVYRGLHGYESISAAQRGAYGGGRIIVRCVIPPNTPFIRGTKGEIVTLALTVGKAVYGKKELRERFNSDKKPTAAKRRTA